MYDNDYEVTIETVTNDLEIDTEYEMFLEQITDSEESAFQDIDESEQENQQVISCDMSALTATMEVIQSDVSQLVSFVESVRASLTCIIFILLFVWAERKIKGAVIKMTGGKKNARID